MECSTPGAPSTNPSTEKVILIGNPNVGKSVIFNYLTGKYVTVSNYPGTTVEITTGSMSVRNKKIQVIDTPGINSLIPMSEDEKVTRDILVREPQAHLVQVMDAKNLRRGLLISLQLLEMGFSFLAVLNMWDEVRSRGIKIHVESLSRTLGIPILKTVATRRKGLEKIKESLTSGLPSSVRVVYPEAIESGVSRIEPLLIDASVSKRSLALMLLAGDESLREWLHRHLSEEAILQIEQIRREIQSRFADSIGYLINQARIRRVNELLADVMESEKEASQTLATTLGKLSIHPFWGIPIVFFVLFVTYEFVGVFGAQVCVKFLEETVFGTWILPPLTNIIQRFIPLSFLQELLVGPYGILTMAMRYAIAIVLPIVGCFFLIFGLMEDSGYLPRLAIMSNQILAVIRWQP
jgi:ferrous iron transport protein B